MRWAESPRETRATNGAPGSERAGVPASVGYGAKFLAVVESGVPVNDFVWRGVHLWPLLRSMLFTLVERPSMLAGAEARRGNLDPASPWQARFAAVQRRFQGIAHPAPPAIAGVAPRPASFQEGRGIAALVLTREEEHQYPTPEGWFAPILDPWIDRIVARGPALKVEIASEEKPRKPMRRHPQTWVQPWTRADLQACGLDATVGEFLDAVDAAGRSVADFTRSELAFALDDQVEEMRRYAYRTILRRFMFGRLIEALSPRCVLVQSYFHESGLGLAWAAREAGIPCAEVQHGAMGAFHGAYSHWTRVPDGGYAMLPSVFVTWNDDSARHVSCWFDPNRTSHRVVVAGRSDLADVRDMPAFAEHGARLSTVVEGAARVVLVTVSPIARVPLPRRLLDAMRHAPADWAWLVRCHPTAHDDPVLGRRAVEAVLREAGVQRVDTEWATRSPLAVVLPFCTDHVTETSSSYLECCAHGVPTVFIDSAAFQLGPELFANGVATLAETASEILAAIARPSEADREALRRRMPTDRSLRDAVLADLLGPPEMSDANRTGGCLETC